MKKAALTFTFLVLIIISLVGAGTFTNFIYDQAGIGKEKTDNLVSYVNDSLDAKENRYESVASSYSLVAGDANFLRQLNESLVHAASRSHTAEDQPCVWRFPSTDSLDTKNLFVKIFPLDTTSTGGEKGIRVHTLVGQQTKDYYNMPDIGVCVVGGVDAFEKEISENWVEYFTEGGDIGDTYLRTSADMFINVGDDNDENYIQFKNVGYFETNPGFDLTIDWFKTDNYLGVQSGNWLYSPREGLVCFVSVYDFVTEDIHEAGFDRSQMLKYFDNHFGDIVPYGSMDYSEFLYVFDGGEDVTDLYYSWEEGIGWKWSPDLQHWMSVDTLVVSGGNWDNQIPARVNVDLIKKLNETKPDPRSNELPSELRHQLNDPTEVHRHNYGANSIEVCRG